MGQNDPVIVDTDVNDVGNNDLRVSFNDRQTQVSIDTVTITEPGFVTIREVLDGQLGQILEVSRYMTPGTYTNLSIPVGVQQRGDVSQADERDLERQLIAILYVDDGDEGFNPSMDTVLEENGQIIARYVATNTRVPQTMFVSNIPTKTVSRTVTYTDTGFVPRQIEINKGETVSFINQSQKVMWVASDTHPAHEILPTFDQFGVSNPGESYQYTFNKKGTWRYHDHVNASQTGTIIVN